MKILKFILTFCLCASLMGCSTKKEVEVSDNTLSENVPDIVEDIKIGNLKHSFHPFIYKDGRMVVFLPSSLKNDVHMYTDSKITFQGKEVGKDEVLKDVKDKGLYTFKNGKYDTDIVFCFSSPIKSLRIANKKDFALEAVDGSLVKRGSMEMKEGDAKLGQKSYTVEMDGKNYALLANSNIPTKQLMNAMAFKLGEKLELEYTPVGEFVDVYMDNAYDGLYYLVDIPETGGEVLELTNNTVKIIEPKNPSKEESKNLEKLYEKVEKKLVRDKIISDQIDKDSWVKYCALQEFVVQPELEAKNTFLYKKKGKLFAGPIWGYDHAFGNHLDSDFLRFTSSTLWIEDGYGKWCKALMQDEEFNADVEALYKDKLSEVVKGLAGDFLPKTAERIKNSANMSCMRWANDFSHYDEDVKNTQKWILERKNFLDEYVDNEDDFHKVVLYFDEFELPVMIKDGESLGTLPKVDSVGKKIDCFEDEKGRTVGNDKKVQEDFNVYAVKK